MRGQSVRQSLWHIKLGDWVIRFPRKKQIMMSRPFRNDDAGTTQGNEFHKNNYIYIDVLLC